MKRNGRKQRNKEEKTKRHRPTCAGSQANQGKGSSGGLALLRESVWLGQTPVLSFVLFSFLTRLSVHGGGVCSILECLPSKSIHVEEGAQCDKGVHENYHPFFYPISIQKGTRT